MLIVELLPIFATTGAKHECTVLPERVDFHVEHLNILPDEWIADKGYGRGPTYAHLQDKKIRAYIPLHDANVGNGLFNQGNFEYDRRNDRYRCPEDFYLYPYDKTEANSIKRYRMLGGHCRDCPLKTHCLPASQKHRARFVYRNLHQDEIDRVRKRQGTYHFKQKLVERKWKIEGLFAEAKQFHGLWRAKYRGLKKFQIQCYMTALVQNIKRVIRFILVFILFFSHRYRKLTLKNFVLIAKFKNKKLMFDLHLLIFKKTELFQQAV